jgi:multicomponent Na+:H+ antiporter subunit G
MALDVVAAALLLAGTAFIGLAGVGLVRLPDALARMHAQTKAATLGLLFVLAGTALRLRHTGAPLVLALVAVFQVLIAPVGAHLLARVLVRMRGRTDLV